jgi:hypothetical protein
VEAGPGRETGREHLPEQQGHQETDGSAVHRSHRGAVRSRIGEIALANFVSSLSKSHLWHAKYRFRTKWAP